jgi:hypothetical protein
VVIIIVPGIKKAAIRVDRANWKIFTGLSSALPSLTSGDGLPTVPFKCAVTLSVATGHADVNGSITIGSEVISFTSATRKTSTTLLTALPTISQSGLDCQILIEALSSGGVNIQKENLTSILIGFKATQKTYMDSTGAFTLCSAQAKTTDTLCVAGAILRVDGIDYTIVQVEPKNKNSGKEYMRKLLLKQ